MIYGVLQIDLRLRGVHSLKDKRSVVQKLVAKVRAAYPISVSEVGDHDLLGNAELGIAVAGSDPVRVENVLQQVLKIIEENCDGEVTDSVIHVDILKKNFSLMPRTTVPEAEALLDQEIKVLDKGFVRLVDYMGGDQRIVQAARVSYGEGTKSVRQDRALIHYLIKHWHTSPFEQVQLTFHCKMPIFIARQWIRHRTARLNEISGRYSIMKDEFYLPEPQQVAFQSANNKQGRADSLPFDEAMAVINQMEQDQKEAYTEYLGMIEKGVARELARTNLPVSLYTEWYWQIDLHNLFHFIRLRMDPHAQYEIRVYAEALAKCAQAVAPFAYEAFEEHILGSVSFSKAECAALARMLVGGEAGLEERPMKAFMEKVEKLHASVPVEAPEEFVTPVG